MILHSLVTRDFRNLAEAEVPFHPRANILVGRNGQGKTNLLEAIYFLATSKSFRTTHTASVFRFDSPSVFVTGRLERDAIERTLSIGLEGGEIRRRVLMINGEKVPLSAYLGAMGVFAYSGARLDVIRGTPEERRRFLDRGVASVQAGYVQLLSRYMRVLRQRNTLLADIAASRQSPSSLGAWDDELTAAASAVHAAREAYAAELAPIFADILRRHRYHVTGIEMVYRPNVVADLPRIRGHEIRARMTIVGPQRDAVEFLVDGRPAAEVLSGGEQKTIVLFLKFAKMELFRRRHDDAALFLLDDVDAELDLEILGDLFANLPRSTQLFATSAKESFLSALEAGPHLRLTLENGRVTSTRNFA